MVENDGRNGGRHVLRAPPRRQQVPLARRLNQFQEPFESALAIARSAVDAIHIRVAFELVLVPHLHAVLLWGRRPHLFWSVTGHHSLWADSLLHTMNHHHLEQLLRSL